MQTDYVVLSHPYLAANSGLRPLNLLKFVRQGELVYHNSPYKTHENLPLSRWEHIHPKHLEWWESTPWGRVVTQHRSFPWNDIWHRDKMGPAIWIYDIRNLKNEIPI